MLSNEDIKATIAILTYNGAEYLEEVLSIVFKQKLLDFEVLIIDSGSKDKTLKIINNFITKESNGRLIEIKKTEFGHGKTRNLAMQEAKGKYVAFLTQDATPKRDDWLASYIKIMEGNKNIALAFGPHLPRTGCNPIIRRDLERHFANFGDSEVVIQEKNKNKKIEGIDSFFSDVNSCIRKSAWKKIPFRDVSYAEDQLIAKDMLEQGFQKAYISKASVFHSHTYPVHQYLRRYFDEYRGLKETLGYSDKTVTLLNFIPTSMKNAQEDIKYIRGLHYSKTEKIKWFFVALLMNLYRRIGAYLGGRYEKLPVWISNLMSLERQRKGVLDG